MLSQRKKKLKGSKVAFIGLGKMGFHIAGFISKAGYAVNVYNRSPGRVKIWKKHNKGQQKFSPAAAASNADFIITMVGNDKDLKEVTLGRRGVINSIKPGAIIIDHTTVSTKITRLVAKKIKKKSAHFLDAPVTGGELGAKNGNLSVMVGGNNYIFKKSLSLIKKYSRRVVLMGPLGSGQLTKMVNQICCAGLIQALAEGLAFSKKAKLDSRKLLQVITEGAAQSWQMDHRSETMLSNKFNFGFAVKWMCKDLKICLQESKKNGASLPITKKILHFYEEIRKHDNEEIDTSSLIKRL